MIRASGRRRYRSRINSSASVGGAAEIRSVRMMPSSTLAPGSTPIRAALASRLKPACIRVIRSASQSSGRRGTASVVVVATISAGTRATFRSAERLEWRNQMSPEAKRVAQMEQHGNLPQAPIVTLGGEEAAPLRFPSYKADGTVARIFLVPDEAGRRHQWHGDGSRLDLQCSQHARCIPPEPVISPTDMGERINRHGVRQPRCRLDQVPQS